MYNQSPSDTLSMIAQLPKNIIIHDMAFDQSGTRIALACSDKSVKIYKKSKHQWKLESLIKLIGAAGWKVKWCHQQFGIVLAVCSLDRIIAVYEWVLLKKDAKQKYQWHMTDNINNLSVQDFKFAPGTKFGLALGIVDSAGMAQLKILSSYRASTSKGPTVEYNASKLGLNCFSWYKKVFDQNLLLALGGKSHETSPLRALEGFKDDSKSERKKVEPIITISFAVLTQSNGILKIDKVCCSGFSQKKAVNDISWAHNNGRSYNMLAVATDNSLKIYEINFKDSREGNKSLEVSKVIDLTSNACYRISWNLFGTYIACSQKKKIRMFKSVCRGVWNQFKQVEDK